MLNLVFDIAAMMAGFWLVCKWQVWVSVVADGRGVLGGMEKCWVVCGNK